ncbi:MAG: 2-hydroxymuconate tautomerase family protein [Candidatus Aerophobetes bacterium]
MPLVKIDMWEGRSEETKEKLIRDVSDTVARTLDVSLDHVTVILYDVPKSNWGVKGVPCSKMS